MVATLIRLRYKNILSTRQFKEYSRPGEKTHDLRAVITTYEGKHGHDATQHWWFRFSGFGRPIGSYMNMSQAQFSEGAFARATDEPRDDSFLDGSLS
ncbi:hypothetical protein COLO4_14440 [Corchorus olitorius]|uniref:Uncharacterized protein n=1 Tax=Corchorus olitorius TaxID=93759 RepID=A0A1R3JS40_9ROSI|nr:hypothetical protein COLO4_14440 [Corchorus olitorius]